MRRLWAYIVSALTAIVLVCTSFIGVMSNINSNMEYSDGETITFRVSNKNPESDAISDYTAVDNIAKKMEERLDNAKITSYTIKTVGYDTIKVSLGENNSITYNEIKTYLSFNGNLGLTYGDRDRATSDEFLNRDAQAYISSYNSYPAVVLPVIQERVEQMLELARTDMSNDDHTNAEETTSQNESGESETSYKYYLYLWYDYDEDKCSFEAATDTSNKYNSRLMMKFEVSSDDEQQFFPGSKKDKLFSLLNLDRNGDGVASIEEKTQAYNSARFFVNLINSGELDYKVVALFSEKTVATTENLVSFGQIKWSRTLFVAVLTFVLLTCLLALFYRWAALAMTTITLASSFLGLLTTIWFSAEFSIYGVIAIVCLALVSIVSGVIYQAKLRDECYKGRTLKKANSEASKKSLLPIIDVHVALIILGVFSFIFGGATLRTFALITVIGGLISLVLNTLILKGMMWLLTNNVSFTGKYHVIGVDEDKVPNLLNEEKQKFFGRYESKDFSKHRKSVGIIFGLLSVACITCAAVFGAMNNGNGFNTKFAAQNSEVYFETTTDDSALKETSITDILNNLYTYTEDEIENNSWNVAQLDENRKSLGDNLDYIYVPKTNYQEINDEDGNIVVTYYEYVAKLKISLTDDVKGFYFDKNDQSMNTFIENETDTINDVLSRVLEKMNIDDKASASLKSNSIYGKNYLNIGAMALAAGVSIAVTGLYIMLRYRLSKGLAFITLTTASTGIAIGLLSMTRVIVLSTVLAAVPVVCLLTASLIIMIMSKDKELIIEDKTHDNSVENRYSLSNKAVSLTASSVLFVVGCFAIITSAMFGFGPEVTAWPFALSFFVGGFATIIVLVLYASTVKMYYKLFKNVHFKSKKKKNKGKNISKKSAEPEEAVFIGIND